jgi:hypothetical protein
MPVYIAIFQVKYIIEADNRDQVEDLACQSLDIDTKNGSLDMLPTIKMIDRFPAIHRHMEANR